VCEDNNSDKGHNEALFACHRGNAGMNSAGFDTARRDAGVKCQGFINDLIKKREGFSVCCTANNFSFMYSQKRFSQAALLN
jgi:hypothetical protein